MLTGKILNKIEDRVARGIARVRRKAIGYEEQSQLEAVPSWKAKCRTYVIKLFCNYLPTAVSTSRFATSKVMKRRVDAAQ